MIIMTIVSNFIGVTMFILAYVNPAYECFRTGEMNNPDIDRLLFLCCYWILFVVLTVCETIAHIFISRVTILAEAKMALLIYLWYHKTKGTLYVYESLLRPYALEMDPFVVGIKGAGDGACLCWKKTTTYSRGRMNEILQFIRRQSTDRRPVAVRASKLLYSIIHSKAENLVEKLKKCGSVLTEENGTTRREMWSLLAAFSWLFCYAFIIVYTSTPKWLIEQLWKVEFLNEVSKWLSTLCKKNEGLTLVVVCSVLAIFVSMPLPYVYLLHSLAHVPGTPRPLKFTPSARCLFECMFVLTCLGATYFVRDFHRMLLALGICFHIIPVMNLVGTKENFGFLDCFLALLIQVSLCLCREYPNYAPLLVAIISAILQLMKQRNKQTSQLHEYFNMGEQIINTEKTMLPV